MPLDVGQIRAARPEAEIHYLATVGSTMQTAALLAADGARHGTVVIAEEQTAGQGRLGRSWISEAEVGIYCSVLLRLRLPASELPIATLLLGLAAADAIQRTTDLACDLRWPNDVLIRERKTAGILAQLAGDCVIAGIGINVNQERMPGDLRTPATSLRIESGGKPHSREAVLIGLLESLDEFAELLEAKGSTAIRAAFAAASSYVLNRRVRLEESGVTGTTAGLDENGFLLVRLDAGWTERVAAGGVRAIH
jgi:BirA family transcriptional regulator, biotin operon repressor / biotin---[acetyl-CoA-carboxylase] ligase